MSERCQYNNQYQGSSPGMVLYISPEDFLALTELCEDAGVAVESSVVSPFDGGDTPDMEGIDIEEDDSEISFKSFEKDPESKTEFSSKLNPEKELVNEGTQKDFDFSKKNISSTPSRVLSIPKSTISGTPKAVSPVSSKTSNAAKESIDPDFLKMFVNADSENDQAKPDNSTTPKEVISSTSEVELPVSSKTFAPTKESTDHAIQTYEIFVSADKIKSNDSSTSSSPVSSKISTKSNQCSTSTSVYPRPCYNFFEPGSLSKLTDIKEGTCWREDFMNGNMVPFLNFPMMSLPSVPLFRTLPQSGPMPFMNGGRTNAVDCNQVCVPFVSEPASNTKVIVDEKSSKVVKFNSKPPQEEKTNGKLFQDTECQISSVSTDDECVGPHYPYCGHHGHKHHFCESCKAKSSQTSYGYSNCMSSSSLDSTKFNDSKFLESDTYRDILIEITPLEPTEGEEDLAKITTMPEITEPTEFLSSYESLDEITSKIMPDTIAENLIQSLIFDNDIGKNMSMESKVIANASKIRRAAIAEINLIQSIISNNVNEKNILMESCTEKMYRLRSSINPNIPKLEEDNVCNSEAEIQSYEFVSERQEQVPVELNPNTSQDVPVHFMQEMRKSASISNMQTIEETKSSLSKINFCKSHSMNTIDPTTGTKATFSFQDIYKPLVKAQDRTSARTKRKSLGIRESVSLKMFGASANAILKIPSESKSANALEYNTENRINGIQEKLSIGKLAIQLQRNSSTNALEKPVEMMNNKRRLSEGAISKQINSSNEALEKPVDDEEKILIETTPELMIKMQGNDSTDYLEKPVEAPSISIEFTPELTIKLQENSSTNSLLKPVEVSSINNKETLSMEAIPKLAIKVRRNSSTNALKKPVEVSSINNKEKLSKRSIPKLATKVQRSSSREALEEDFINDKEKISMESVPELTIKVQINSLTNTSEKPSMNDKISIRSTPELSKKVQDSFVLGKPVEPSMNVKGKTSIESTLKVEGNSLEKLVEISSTNGKEKLSIESMPKLRISSAYDLDNLVKSSSKNDKEKHIKSSSILLTRKPSKQLINNLTEKSSSTRRGNSCIPKKCSDNINKNLQNPLSPITKRNKTYQTTKKVESTPTPPKSSYAFVDRSVSSSARIKPLLNTNKPKKAMISERSEVKGNVERSSKANPMNRRSSGATIVKTDLARSEKQEPKLLKINDRNRRESKKSLTLKDKKSDNAENKNNIKPVERRWEVKDHIRNEVTKSRACAKAKTSQEQVGKSKNSEVKISSCKLGISKNSDRCLTVNSSKCKLMSSEITGSKTKMKKSQLPVKIQKIKREDSGMSSLSHTSSSPVKKHDLFSKYPAPQDSPENGIKDQNTSTSEIKEKPVGDSVSATQESLPKDTQTIADDGKKRPSSSRRKSSLSKSQSDEVDVTKQVFRIEEYINPILFCPPSIPKDKDADSNNAWWDKMCELYEDGCPTDKDITPLERSERIQNVLKGIEGEHEEKKNLISEIASICASRKPSEASIGVQTQSEPVKSTPLIAATKSDCSLGNTSASITSIDSSSDTTSLTNNFPVWCRGFGMTSPNHKKNAPIMNVLYGAHSYHHFPNVKCNCNFYSSYPFSC